MKYLNKLGISPAPWRNKDQDVCDSEGRRIMLFSHSDKDMANAQLVKMAPEMYDILQKIYNHWLPIGTGAGGPGMFQEVQRILQEAGGVK